jgi:hypothetical protein
MIAAIAASQYDRYGGTRTAAQMTPKHAEIRANLAIACELFFEQPHVSRTPIVTIVTTSTWLGINFGRISPTAPHIQARRARNNSIKSRLDLCILTMSFGPFCSWTRPVRCQNLSLRAQERLVVRNCC